MKDSSKGFTRETIEGILDSEVKIGLLYDVIFDMGKDGEILNKALTFRFYENFLVRESKEEGMMEGLA